MSLFFKEPVDEETEKKFLESVMCLNYNRESKINEFIERHYKCAKEYMESFGHKLKEEYRKNIEKTLKIFELKISKEKDLNNR